MSAFPAAAAGRSRGGRERVTFARVMVSEWIKLRSLRSSWYTLGAAVAVMVLVGLIIGSSGSSESDSGPGISEGALASAPLGGLLVAQLVVGVLGVLFVTGDYATGMIRSTFAAVPRRLHVVGAKVAVFSIVSFVAMTIASFAAYYGAQLFLGSEGTSISDPGVLRAILGTGVYLTLIGLLGSGIGWILRSTAGAITTLSALILVVPNILPLLGSWADSIVTYLPGEAGQAITESAGAGGSLAPFAGAGVLALWVSVVFAAAAVLVRRRDA